MSFDPKLKAAMAEIEAVCRKYNCGGHISLVSPTHGEFRFVLPSWTGIRLLPKGDGHAWHVKLHMKSNPEQANLASHFIFSLQDVCTHEFLALEKLIGIIKENVEVEHEPFSGFEPHRPENSP